MVENELHQTPVNVYSHRTNVPTSSGIHFVFFVKHILLLLILCSEGSKIQRLVVSVGLETSGYNQEESFFFFFQLGTY